MSSRNYHHRTSYCFLYNHDNDSKPHYRECPTKMWRLTGVEKIHSFTVGQAFLFFCLCPCCLSIVQVLIFSFIIHLSLLLTAGNCQILPYIAVKEMSYISTSLEWMMTLFCNTELSRRRNSSLLPSAWFHCNCTNSLIIHTHTDSLKYNLPKLSHLCSNVYTYSHTQLTDIANVQAVNSHCKKKKIN